MVKNAKLSAAWNAFADSLEGKLAGSEQIAGNLTVRNSGRGSFVPGKPMAFLGGDMNKSSSPHPPVNPPLRAALKGYFTIGSSKIEVLAAQGQPSSFSSDRFSYGLSEVKFDSSGRVKGWDSYSSNKLKAMIEIDAGKYSGMSYFTIGSSKELVVAVQGQPDERFSNRFGYGLSEVNFDSSGRVKDWGSYSSNKLKAKLVLE